jgi:hypothetical protein
MDRMDSYNNLKRKVTRSELVGLTLAGIIFVGSLSLVLAFPENGIVQALLGGRRIFVFWLALGAAIWLNRERCDRLIERMIKKFSATGN